MTSTFRVRYFECDQMGVAHHANYFVWFEASRADFCRERGIDYIQMEKEGLFLPVVEAKCRYIAPARYDDEVSCTVSVSEMKRRTVLFHYLLMRGDTLLAKGETYQMLIDGSGRPRVWPEAVAELFVGK